MTSALFNCFQPEPERVHSSPLPAQANMRDGAWHQRGDGCYLGLSARPEEHKALDCERSGVFSFWSFFFQALMVCINTSNFVPHGRGPPPFLHFIFLLGLIFLFGLLFVFVGKNTGRLSAWAGGKNFPPAFFLNLKVTRSLAETQKMIILKLKRSRSAVELWGLVRAQARVWSWSSEPRGNV